MVNNKKKKNPIDQVSKGLNKIDQDFRKGMGKLLSFKNNSNIFKKVKKKDG